MSFSLAYCIDHTCGEAPCGIVALGFKVTVCGARGDITIRRRNPAGDRRALLVAVGIIDTGSLYSVVVMFVLTDIDVVTPSFAAKLSSLTLLA